MATITYATRGFPGEASFLPSSARLCQLAPAVEEGAKLTRTYKLADILAGRLQLSHVADLNLTREDSAAACRR